MSGLFDEPEPPAPLEEEVEADAPLAERMKRTGQVKETLGDGRIARTEDVLPGP